MKHIHTRAEWPGGSGGRDRRRDNAIGFDE
jgi:hypothetical protein